MMIIYEVSKQVSRMQITTIRATFLCLRAVTNVPSPNKDRSTKRIPLLAS